MLHVTVAARDHDTGLSYTLEADTRHLNEHREAVVVMGQSDPIRTSIEFFLEDPHNVVVTDWAPSPELPTEAQVQAFDMAWTENEHLSQREQVLAALRAALSV